MQTLAKSFNVAVVLVTLSDAPSYLEGASDL